VGSFFQVAKQSLIAAWIKKAAHLKAYGFCLKEKES